MRLLIQRVSEASVIIDKETRSRIKNGLLLLVGIEASDTEEDIEYLGNKTVNMRIFDDLNGVMNKSVRDIDGEILIVSQFTLYASTKKEIAPLTCVLPNRKYRYPHTSSFVHTYLHYCKSRFRQANLGHICRFIS